MSEYEDFNDYSYNTGPSMAQRRVKRKKNKNKAILRLLILLIMVFLVYLLIRFAVGLFQLTSMKVDINNLTQQTAEIQTALDELNLQVEQLQSDSYIEEKARALGMIKEGENQVVTEPEEASEADTSETADTSEAADSETTDSEAADSETATNSSEESAEE